MNRFSINDYECNFVRCHLLPVESIYIFTELCRMNYAMQVSVIIRPTEILVDREMFDAFLFFTKELNIFFSRADGKVVVDLKEDDLEIFSVNTPHIRHTLSQHKKS